MTVNAERITALINNPRSPFAEADRAHLETLSEERIAAAEALAVEPVQQAAAAAEGTVTVSEEELSSLRSMKAERDNTRAAQKRVLVGKLKGAQKQYSEARLQAMELEALRDIAGLLEIDAPPADVEFVSAEQHELQPTEAVEPPKPWSLATAARKAQSN